jgi:hypothetical protein
MSCLWWTLAQIARFLLWNLRFGLCAANAVHDWADAKLKASGDA